ncbi:MAG: site-specific DNA-methyltransferase [Dehalococcoidia bacterium]|nr:site-specific DNA-methyltransferase [Dehalococcoidia bacterium]
METNVLYYGDNLEILRKYIPDNSIDLIYLDPPFNSKATYNILFKEPTGEPSQAQITAFDDTWHWGKESERAFQELVNNAPMNVVELISAFRRFIHQNDMMAYLVMMCVRLLELRRVLKETGSIYLHCDTTASHYLKILMDTIFGVANFRNEISWRRSQTRSSISRIFKRSHDILLFYSKTSDYLFNLQYKDLSEASLDLYSREDEKGLHRLVPLVVSGKRNGETGQIWRGIDPNLYGKGGSHWVTKPSNLDEYDKQGLIVWPQKAGGLPQLKYYLEDNKGVPVTDFWDDIDIIPSSSSESMGYPTQKPESLLERMIRASSDEGDIVLDPFCGCGTALVVAQKLNRKWLGIDVTHLAIGVMKYRLKKLFPTIAFKVTGEPEDLSGAKELAKDNKYEFQWWAVSLIGGQPYGDKKKGADTGIDGYLYFMDEKDKVKKAIISVKGGGTSVKDIRDLGHVIDREKAEIGIFITLEQPTRPMGTEAVTKGFYHSPLGKDFPRIQILTIEELLNGKKPDIPPWIAPIQAPPKHKEEKGKSARLL